MGSGPVLALGRAHTKPRRYESARHGVTAVGSSARCLQARSPPSVSLDAERCGRDARRGARIGGRALVAYRTRRGAHASPGAAESAAPAPVAVPVVRALDEALRDGEARRREGGVAVVAAVVPTVVVAAVVVTAVVAVVTVVALAGVFLLRHVRD